MLFPGYQCALMPLFSLPAKLRKTLHWLLFASYSSHPVAPLLMRTGTGLTLFRSPDILTDLLPYSQASNFTQAAANFSLPSSSPSKEHQQEAWL